MKEYKTYLFSAFGTDNELQLWNFDTSLQQKLFSLIEQYESDVSYYREDSIIHRINKNAGISPTPINQDVLCLLQKVFYYHEISPVFNVLLKPIQNEYMKFAHSLSLYHRMKLKQQTNIKQIVVSQNAVMLEKKNMQLDLGGIAKGYIVDKVTDCLLFHHVTKGIVNFGGDVRVWNTSEECFHVGIRNPFSSQVSNQLVISLGNGSLSTSGTYERFNRSNRAFHHIIDPRTMKPSNSELISVSVIGATALETDVFATIFLILGVKDSLQLIEEIHLKCDVVFITKAGKVYCTKKLKRSIIESETKVLFV